MKQRSIYFLHFSTNININNEYILTNMIITKMQNLIRLFKKIDNKIDLSRIKIIIINFNFDKNLNLNNNFTIVNFINLILFFSSI